MSCIFCDSYYHVSEYCEKYVSDEARKERILSKNLFLMKETGQSYVEKRNQTICNYCLNTDCGYAVNGECGSIKKCYICYTKDQHHTAYCPDRFKTPKIFIPNINQNLLHRFFNMFDADEKYLLAFLSPAICSERSISPLTVSYELRFGPEMVEEYNGKNAYICKELNILYHRSDAESHQKIFKQIISKTWIFVSEILFIDYLEFSSTDIPLLLSSRTKKLYIGKTAIPLKFKEIFKKAPNLDEFTCDSIICNEEEVESLKVKYENNFKKLTITVDSKFDVKWLPTIMKNTKPNAEICLYVNYETYHSSSQAQKLFSKDYGKHFERVRGRSTKDKKYLSIFLQTKNANAFMGLFVLSKKLLSKNCE